MRLKWMAAALAGAFMLGATASAQPPAAPELPAAAATATVAPQLTKQDLDGWLDGVMSQGLSTGDIAGAVVVVVKDGQVLTERGFGYADVASHRKVDPQKTLFRPGSVSKTFTWTAVMQLVEQGRLDLDKDVNAYLDFKIPPYQGKPVTLRNLMTHTGGFEIWDKSVFVGSPQRLLPLGKLLARWVPTRIFPPGEVPAYSNYGASLAGYIVQRVSGEPFDDYIERHIFAPLGMAHSTFRQPLPERFKADISTAYARASQPQPYELVAAEPCGSLSATADDMARYMIAHLNDGEYAGQRILRPETARLMHAQGPQHNPPLNAMALGFYHDDRNGHSIIAHGGDTTFFHSDIHLLLDQHVGLFISLNSAGKDGAAYPLRDVVLQGFVDRYFPGPRPHLPTASTAKAHAALMQGAYWSSLRSGDTFLSVLGLLGQAKAVAGPDGTLTVSSLHDNAGAPKVWREVAPFVWKDAQDDATLAAVVRDGKVVNFAVSDLPPAFVFQPVPGWAKASWNLPLAYAMLAVLLSTLLLWPIQVLVRRRFGARFALQGREAMLYRSARVAAAVQIAAVVAWFMMISSMNNATSDGTLDGMQRTAQVLTLLGILAAGVMIWNAVVTALGRERGWWAKGSSALIALAGVAFVWFAFSLHLMSFSLLY